MNEIIGFQQKEHAVKMGFSGVTRILEREVGTGSPCAALSMGHICSTLMDTMCVREGGTPWGQEESAGTWQGFVATFMCCSLED